MFNAQAAIKKWNDLLEHDECSKITDSHRKAVTALMLENQEIALRESADAASFNINENDTTTGNVGKFDPVLIALVRRAMPNLIAYDVGSVQPMSGPTGLIFAMKSRYAQTDAGIDYTGGKEALFDTPETAFSGPHTTADGEALSTVGSNSIASMGFDIVKSTVTAKTRALKAGYTMELAQDMKAVHGMDAEAQLANILSAEILGEINREVIGAITDQAVVHTSGVTSGVIDLGDALDTQGARWGAERFKALAFEIEKACNAIALATRRGKGNFVIVSANVASALAASGMLDYAPALSTSLNVDPAGNTFAGTLNGRIKVYVDPYASGDTVVVGYRGANAYDAGIFYCPYVPLTMVKGIGEEDFQPRIAFKTRYGLVSNPFALAANEELAANNTNPYFRKFSVIGL